MQKTRVAIHGAAGRMGQRLVALAHQDENLELVAAIDYAEHPKLETDAGVLAGVGELELPLTASLDVDADAMIDFSLPAGAESATAMCVEKGVGLVMATTGLSDAQQEAIRQAANTIPVVWAPNMSLAVNLTMKLTEMAAKALKDHPGGADVEIIERHHRFKEDSPSGTALKFGEIIAEQMGHTKHLHGREGRIGARTHEEIGYHAVRTGDNPGEHTIVFGLLGETVELRVGATNRDSYALGALGAARFLTERQPGLYDMYDVLGL